MWLILMIAALILLSTVGQIVGLRWRASSTGIVGGTVTQVRLIRFRTLVTGGSSALFMWTSRSFAMG
jgi:hypothetical protein